MASFSKRFVCVSKSDLASFYQENRLREVNDQFKVVSAPQGEEGPNSPLGRDAVLPPM